MGRILGSALFDNLIFILSSLLIFITFIRLLKNIIKYSNKNNYNNFTFYYTLSEIILIMCLISFSVYKLISLTKYTNTIMGVLFTIFVIFCFFKMLNFINKNNMEKSNFSNDDIIIISFSQYMYLFFFNKNATEIFINIFNLINNNYLGDFFLFTYFSIKLTLILFFIIMNSLLILKSIYQITNINLLFKIKNIITTIENYNILSNETSVEGSISNINNMIKKSSKNYLSYIFIFYKLTETTFKFCMSYIIKEILIIIFSLIYKPLIFFKKLLINERKFMYLLIRLCTIFSLILYYAHILNHDFYNLNAIKLYEIVSFALIVALLFTQIFEIDNK